MRFSSGATRSVEARGDPFTTRSVEARGDAFRSVARAPATVQDPEAAARDHVREQYPALPASVGDCADAVADGWAREWTADRDAVVGPLRAELRTRGLLARFPVVLAGAAAAAGYELPADPVPAPPYVVVTSRGPVLRATVADGRLVVRFDVFAVRRADGVRYVRADGDPLAVAFR